jgi:histidyl-tRNA synthetase
MNRRRVFSKNKPLLVSNTIKSELSGIWDYLIFDIRDTLRSSGYHNRPFSFSQDYSIFNQNILNQLNISDEKILLKFKYRSNNTIVLGSPGPLGILKSVIDNNIDYKYEPLKIFDYGISLVDDDNNMNTLPKQQNVFKAECIGEVNPIRDAEIILTSYRMLESQGISNLTININGLGGVESRNKYYLELLSKTPSRFNSLAVSLLYNPLRLYNKLLNLDLDMNLRLPQIVDYLSSEESQYFKSVLEFLESLDIPYNLDSSLEGSIGFNEGVYFEIVSQDYPDNVLVRGGRHNQLFRLLGGDSKFGSVGIEIYIETLLELMQKSNTNNLINFTKPNIFIASIGLEGQKSALKILSLIQKHGLEVKESFGIKSLKQQLVKAKKLDSEITLIIGRKEAVDGTVILRDKESENQEIIPIDKLMSILSNKMSKNS